MCAAPVHGYARILHDLKPPLAEKLGPVALRNRERILARTRKVASQNLALLDQFFNAITLVGHVQEVD